MMKETETRNNNDMTDSKKELIRKIEETNKHICFLAKSLDDLIETGKAIASDHDILDKKLHNLFLNSIIKSFKDKNIKP